MTSVVRALNTVSPTIEAPKFTVAFNKRSVFISIIMFINVAIMPLKAYISEPFPWEPNENLEFLKTCSTNLTACAPIAIHYFKNQSQNMYDTDTYIQGDTWDIFRFPLPKLPSLDDNPAKIFLELPFATFNTQFQRQQALQLAKREINYTEFQSIGATRFFGSIVDYAIIWTDSKNAMYYAFVRQTTTSAWLIFKLIYRCALSIYIMTTMWKQYYRQYCHLATNLRMFGIEKAKPSDRIDIIMGDPTSIILLNPYVSIVFIADIWVSIEFVTRAILRLDQVENIGLCLLACLYLSRMLWLAYGVLILISYILKKLHKEKIFDEADPTLTALAVMITTGPITYSQSRIVAFIDAYNFLCQSFAIDDNSNEAALPVILFCLTIGSLPIVFGLLPRCPAWICGKISKTSSSTPYGSFMANDIKHRFTHYFNLMTLSEPAHNVQGGTMYQLFAHDRKFKRSLGMSQRGADCYLLFGYGERRTSVRLSLLSCLDPAFIKSSTTDSTTAAGRLSFEKNEVKVVRGAFNSLWIA